VLSRSSRISSLPARPARQRGEWERVAGDGIRMLDWASRLPRLLSREPILVCSPCYGKLWKEEILETWMLYVKGAGGKRKANGFGHFDKKQTRSVPSPALSPSVAVSSLELSSQQRCTEPSSSAATTCTISLSTNVTRSATRTSRHTFPQLSVSRRVIRLPLVNAGLCRKLYPFLLSPLSIPTELTKGAIKGSLQRPPRPPSHR